MSYLSKKSAEKFYTKLLVYHQMENSLAIKIPSYKNELENEILAKITGINHFKPKYENGTNMGNGQKNWLLDNQIRKTQDGNLIGTIPERIVTGIIYFFAIRNTAEHEKVISYAAYLGIIDIMAQAISFFSGTSIPDEIQAICDGNFVEKNLKTKTDKAKNQAVDITSKDKEIKELNGKLASKDKEIKILNEKLAVKDKESREYYGRLVSIQRIMLNNFTESWERLYGDIISMDNVKDDIRVALTGEKSPIDKLKAKMTAKGKK